MIFRDLEFEVMPICKEGSTFPFKANISLEELINRIQNSRFSSCISTTNISNDCLFIRVMDTHIGTYNTDTNTLYTGSREYFCQMK